MTDVTMGLDGLSELKFSKELEAAINEVRNAPLQLQLEAYSRRPLRSAGDAVHRSAGLAGFQPDCTHQQTLSLGGVALAGKRTATWPLCSASVRTANVIA